MTRNMLVLAAAAALLAACASRPKEPPPKPFVGTRWDVVLDLPIPGEQPYLRFGDGRMEGFGGCNKIAARYVQDTVGARAIAVGRVDRGTRACETGTQLAEMRMLEVLQAVSSYAITGDAMTMTGSGGMLKFRAHRTPEEIARQAAEAAKK
jgi:heat shock protein HslJ